MIGFTYSTFFRSPVEQAVKRYASSRLSSPNPSFEVKNPQHVSVRGSPVRRSKSVEDSAFEEMRL